MLTSVADARVCAALTRKHARTFAFASTFLPPRKQRAAFALYTFCRRADDLVDRVDRDLSPEQVRGEFTAYRERLVSALRGEPDDAAFRELAWTVGEFAIGHALLHELLDGIERDLTPTVYDTWEQLAGYAEGVASSVGAMLVHVFGSPGATVSAAERQARTLGTAMQLTNILRDVGEDARRGRCYLPQEELATFGLTRDDILAGNVDAGGTAWRRFASFQITRARALYHEGMAGIPLLEADARRCATICGAGYAAILDAIERNAYDTFSTRARVSRWERARIVLGTWWDDARARFSRAA